MNKKNKYFEGIYFKIQDKNNSMAFIPGISADEAFIQYIDINTSYYFKYDKSKYIRKNNSIIIDDNVLSPEGLTLNLKSEDLNIQGIVSFTKLTPLKHHIMGPFKYLPMPCMHGIISMRHNVNGNITVKDNQIIFNNAIGYIEEDKGISFPTNYIWLHCNLFNNNKKNNRSIMLAIADIPFLKTSFKGVICAIKHKGNEHILATYKGVEILNYTDKQIILKQGKLYLKVDIFENNGQELLAPNKGNMIRTIKENICCKGKISFYINNIPIFEQVSDYISFEYVGK